MKRREREEEEEKEEKEEEEEELFFVVDLDGKKRKETGDTLSALNAVPK